MIIIFKKKDLTTEEKLAKINSNYPEQIEMLRVNPILLEKAYSSNVRYHRWRNMIGLYTVALSLISFMDSSSPLYKLFFPAITVILIPIIFSNYSIYQQRVSEVDSETIFKDTNPINYQDELLLIKKREERRKIATRKYR